MREKKLGFIGCGNMANAVIGGILHAGLVQPSDILGSCSTQESRERAQKENGIEVTGDNREVVRRTQTVFLCVKPQFMDSVLEEIRDEVTEDQLLVSIAAGKDLAYYASFWGDRKIHIVRLMPNTPALVGEAMTAGCGNAYVTGEEMALVKKLCSACGEFEVVPENLFDAVTGVSGSSPAYVFLFIEAMADAAVQGGMPRKQAYKFAAQAVMGSAKMVLETGMHPAQLKDMVCSPAGTTIEAVRVLEEKGFRSAVFEGTKACIDKSGEMRQKHS